MLDVKATHSHICFKGFKLNNFEQFRLLRCCPNGFASVSEVGMSVSQIIFLSLFRFEAPKNLNESNIISMRHANIIIYHCAVDRPKTH